MNANGDLEWGSWVEKGGVGEFESARVYLARWARIVAEEGERARRREAQALPTSASTELPSESTSLGIFELLHSTSNLPTPKSTRDPDHPVDERIWAGWFNVDGSPKINVEEMRREVFRRGISSKGTLRKRIWPLILGVHEWNATHALRMDAWEAKQ